MDFIKKFFINLISMDINNIERLAKLHFELDQFKYN